MVEDPLYPPEIRRYEKEIIDFIIDSGKDKRSSEVESHILGYFFLHPQLTQSGIQALSAEFREKEISLGSISNFLNEYQEYGVIEKTQHPDKRTTFLYSLKEQSMESLYKDAQSSGVKSLISWIQKFEVLYRALTQKFRESSSKKEIASLLSRIKEIRDFFIFHYFVMKNFFEGDFNPPKPQSLDINSLEFNIDISNSQITELKSKKWENIEQEALELLVHIPLFILEQPNYIPIYCQLLLRKRMTQSELRKTTKLSSGTISEGLRYLLGKELIRFTKIEGVRKRFYYVPSVAFSNYLKQYRRFERIKQMRTRLEQVHEEMISNQEKLQSKEGFNRVLFWLKAFIKQYTYIDRGLQIFQKALNYHTLHDSNE
jgi:DNA-binding transcriptional regulator GbsR (MarR family)